MLKGLHLDEVLVPLGMVVLLSYHLWLLDRLLRRPTKTVMGINALNRRVWVQSMMEDPMKTGVLAVQTLRNNIMASTLLASMAIMLSSLIAVLMSNGWGASRYASASHAAADAAAPPFFDPARDTLMTAKFFSILSCFLVSFLFNVQSIRYYSHASVLINVPAYKNRAGGSLVTNQQQQRITPDYVARTLNRGSYFWSLGLRMLYFSFPLFLWIFGPIPMFACCIVMVFLLYFLDVSFDWSLSGGESSGGASGDCQEMGAMEV